MHLSGKEKEETAREALCNNRRGEGGARDINVSRRSFIFYGGGKKKRGLVLISTGGGKKEKDRA